MNDITKNFKCLYAKVEPLMCDKHYLAAEQSYQRLRTLIVYGQQCGGGGHRRCGAPELCSRYIQYLIKNISVLKGQKNK